MTETIANGIELFLTVQNFMAIFGGVVVGVLVGAIPGMGAAMAVAIGLPFTFHMDAVTGILMLTGIYKGAFYGGSISAILVNTPGTPAAACTVLDGYPMARQGRAREALDMALYASCVADFISNLSLIFLAGLIASWALEFGPPEFFALIVFSMTIIAGVSGDSLFKGLASAAFGFLAATVGQDLFYGTGRFDFGSSNMLGGLSLVPVLIGLFALPDIIDRYARDYIGGQHVKKVGGGAPATLKQFRACLPTIIRGGLIGVGLGAIPGIGGAPAAFLSYSEARRKSKTPEKFGKGAIEGVAAAESGNNGVCGATLIPLLSLGVPGDIVTAILLGAFMIHGLQPGPLMFQQNLDTIYAIYCGLLLSSIFMFMSGKVAIRYFAKVAKIPDRLLMPVVIVLCFFGAFVINNSLFDLFVMTTAGLVGFIMFRANIPVAPFLIAFVLGPIFEDNFRRSLLLSRGELDIFLRGPICWAFAGLTVATVMGVVVKEYRSRAAAKQSASNAVPDSRDTKPKAS